MIDSSAPIEQPASDPAPPIDAAPDQPPADAPPPVAEDDDVLEPELQAQVIDIPDGDKLVPLSALKGARGELKALKKAAADMPSLKQQLEQAQREAASLAPLAEAFRAMQQAQSQQPQQHVQPQAPPPEDTRELEEIARDFDFYKGDGTPDLDKARRVQARETKRATEIAQQQTAPLVQHTLEGQVQHNLGRALATVHPVTKQQADPKILGALVAQIRQQPNGLQTLANPEAIKQIWLNAYALSTFQQQAPVAAPAAPAKDTPAPPVFTERSGGRVEAPRALNALEKRAAKDAGMTEAEYLAEAKKMPW